MLEVRSDPAHSAGQAFSNLGSKVPGRMPQLAELLGQGHDEVKAAQLVQWRPAGKGGRFYFVSYP